MLNFYDFIQVYVFTTNHHLKLNAFTCSQHMYETAKCIKNQFKLKCKSNSSEVN